jgi:hypothetical protein
MQTKIFNRMCFIAFGKLKNSFQAWSETVNRVHEELTRRREEVVMRLAKATMSQEQLAFFTWREHSYGA